LLGGMRPDPGKAIGLQFHLMALSPLRGTMVALGGCTPVFRNERGCWHARK
jgi:hypothetical protein